MPQYFVAIYRHRDVEPAAVVTEEVAGDIDKLNADMVAAGVRVFVGGLQSPREARSFSNGSLADGPYLETSSYLDGFWVLDVLSFDEALEWGRKAAVACRASVEVRPFH